MATFIVVDSMDPLSAHTAPKVGVPGHVVVRTHEFAWLAQVTCLPQDLRFLGPIGQRPEDPVPIIPGVSMMVLAAM